MNIIFGGDVGYTETGIKLTDHLSSDKLVQGGPDLIIVGGDVAYDDAMDTCYYSWDTYFWMFEKQFDKL